MPKPLKFPTKVLIGFDDLALGEIDSWRRKQADIPTRSEAIRRLVKKAFSRVQPTGRRSAAASKTASDLAGTAIDRLADTSAPGHAQAGRKRRLLQGPKEFREMRAKARKPKV